MPLLNGGSKAGALGKLVAARGSQLASTVAGSFGRQHFCHSHQASGTLLVYLHADCSYIQLVCANPSDQD